MLSQGNRARRTPRLGVVAVVVGLLSGVACQTRLNPALDGFTCDPRTDICVRADGGLDSVEGGGGVDGEVGGDAETGGGAIVIVAPATSPTYTNGTIAIRVSFDPATTEATEVALFTGDTKLVDLTPPFSFVWDTKGVAEGPYSLTARARIGGRAVTSSPVTVVVDRTAPSVVLGSRVPAPGASEVSLAQPIQLAFSEPILPSSASDAITLVQASGAIATTATLAADGKALTVALIDRSKVVLSAAAPITLTASVSPTVTDLAGNAITAPPQWSWTVPLWLDYGTVRGESPSLALDATGEPLISTTFEPGAIGSRVYRLQVSRHLQGTSWDTSAGSPQTADTLTLYGSTSITVGTDGRPIVAWSEQPMGGPAASIHVARWSGSAWESTYPPLDQVPGSKTDGYTPSLTLGSTNQPMVAWAEVGTNSVTDVYVAKWTGSTWTQLPALGVIGASSPVLLARGGGEPIVGWVAGLGAGGVSSWTGAAWSTNNFPSSYWASLALTKAKRPVVAFIDGSTVRVRYVDANPEEYAPAISGRDPKNPHVAIDTHDRAVVAWSDSGGSGRNIKVVRWTGTEWDTSFGSLSALPAAGTDANAPVVAVDAADFPILGWQELDPIRNVTYVRKSNR
jgi:hypothetical protein